jgi:Glycosyl transferase family 2
MLLRSFWRNCHHKGIIDKLQVVGLRLAKRGAEGVSMPVFSIVIATHGRPQLLERALKSLRASTFASYETIVVSDESNPEAFKAARPCSEPQCRY